jgi:monofunctional biosynthetic peptidoglycan transglycosylase
MFKKRKIIRLFSIGTSVLTLLSIFLIGFFLYNKSVFFVKNIRSIQLLKNEYFEVKVIGENANYQQVKNIPNEWVTLNKISKRVTAAIIDSEDQKFYYHKGYDIDQIKNIVDEKFVQKKDNVRGASTITQQLVKNVYLTNEKTISRKLVELYLATYLDEHVSKEKILECYFNIVEFGPGIFGIKKAAKFYFKKNPHELNAREAAFLAMLLPGPKKYSRSFWKKSLTPFAKSRIEAILLQMLRNGQISNDEYTLNLNSKMIFES